MNDNKVIGNSIVGIWYCPKCKKTFYPNEIKNFDFDYPKNEHGKMGYKYPKCPYCNAILEYDEAE